ncbi:MAG TPA: DUF6152 family protein, partial [Gammaproteobacteria bacterium]
MRSEWTIVAGLTAFAGAAQAHHGITGQFDTSTTFEVSGVVTSLDFVNPHSYVNFDVTQEDGSVLPWRCEMRAATVLRRSGWSEEMFPPGTEITIHGSPDRRDSQTCYMITVTFADGTTVERYGQLHPDDMPAVGAERPAYLANGQPNISGDWAATQRLQTGAGVLGFGMGMGMGGGQPAAVHPTEAGLAAAAGYVAATDNPRFQCMAVNIFNDWTFDQHVNRIIQEDDTITLQYGFMDIVRAIHLDMAEHPAEITPSKAGHSIGHWEGDTLVVDTVGFEPGYLNTRTGTMYSEQL